MSWEIGGKGELLSLCQELLDKHFPGQRLRAICWRIDDMDGWFKLGFTYEERPPMPSDVYQVAKELGISEEVMVKMWEAHDANG